MAGRGKLLVGILLLTICGLLAVAAGASTYGKGEFGPGERQAEQFVLDISQLGRPSGHDADVKGDDNGAIKDRAWATVKSETFEGTFPNEWIVQDWDGVTNGEYYWDDTSCNPDDGAWSGWVCDGGASGYSPCVSGQPGRNYQNDMGMWMVYGPFSLADAGMAQLVFDHWTKTELGYDYLRVWVSLDGTNWYGYNYSGDFTQNSGNDNGYITETLDLTSVPTLGNVCGQPQVWVAFAFTSDHSVAARGTYLDNIVLRKDTCCDLSMNDWWWVQNGQVVGPLGAPCLDRSSDAELHMRVENWCAHEILIDYFWLGSSPRDADSEVTRLTPAAGRERVAPHAVEEYVWNWEAEDLTNGFNQSDIYDIVVGVETLCTESYPSDNQRTETTYFCPLRHWTVMVFQNGDNNLEGWAIDDLNEMEVAGSTGCLTIVSQIDRAAGFDTSNGNWTGARRYLVTQDPNGYDGTIRSTLVQDLGEVDMGNPQVLSDFACWAISNYPAEHYALVVWDHGGGWRVYQGGERGISWDDQSGNSINLPELDTALTQIETCRGGNLDVVGYDACLMAMLEVDYVTALHADWRVGSEKTEPGDGWDYVASMGWLKTNCSTATPQQLADRIATDYGAFYGPSETQSSVEMADIRGANVAGKVNDLATYLLTAMCSNKAALDYAWSNVRRYGTEFADLYHFAQLLRDQSADATTDTRCQAVMDAVAAAVSVTRGETNDRGVSIYLPACGQYTSTYVSQVAFAQATQWDEFLQAYCSQSSCCSVLFYEGHVPSWCSLGGVYADWGALLLQHGIGSQASSSSTVTAQLLAPHEVVVIAVPTVGFTADELTAIQDYVGVTGRVVVIGDSDIFDNTTTAGPEIDLYCRDNEVAAAELVEWLCAAEGGGLLLIGEWGEYAQNAGSFAPANQLAGLFGIHFEDNVVYHDTQNDVNNFWPVIGRAPDDLVGVLSSAVTSMGYYAGCELTTSGQAFPIARAGEGAYRDEGRGLVGSSGSDGRTAPPIGGVSRAYTGLVVMAGWPRPGGPCSIAVTSPTAGVCWEVGSQHAITWTSQSAGSNVKIEYSTNGGSSWTTIIAPTANDGSYDWTVPNAPSSSCLVRICSTTDTQCCGTSGTFSIGYVEIATRTFACAEVCPSHPTARVTVTIVPDQAYSGFALDENPPAGWTIAPVSATGSPAYNPTTNTWLWLSVTAGQTLTVVYDLTRNPSAAYGTYQVTGRVQSAAPALDQAVRGQTDIVWKADPCGCACCLEFLAAHWDGTTVNASDPCQISTSQILAAISWWANPASGPAAVSGVVCPPSDWPISTTKILQMIALWSQSACVDDCTPPWTGRTSAAERVGANATRAINPDTVARGGTVRVAVTINVTEAVMGLALDENPPTGWTLTPVSATGSPAYNPTLQTWLWLNAAIGQLTVEYDLTVPGDACCCPHAFTGTVESALPVFNNAVGGETQVTVAGPGCGPSCWNSGTVEIAVSGSGVAAGNAAFGVNATASDCLDAADALLPPNPPGNYTAAWFDLPATCGVAPQLTRDVRTPIPCLETREWAMTVYDFGPDTTVTLTWTTPAIPGTGGCGTPISVRLRDTVSGATVDMQAVGTYTYTKAGNPNARSFVITVGCLGCTDEATTLPDMGWQMISLPGRLCEPCTWGQGECGDLVCALGDDLSPFFAYRYDADLGAYTYVPPASQICHQPGMGLWIYTGDQFVAVDAEVETSAGDVVLPLKNGWNQIGNPYTFSIGAGSILIRCGAQELSLLSAQAQGWISAALYGYDTGSGAYVEINPATGCIPVWTGCWIRTYRGDCTVVFRPVACVANAPAARRLGVAEVRALELPPLPPFDPQAADIVQTLNEISVASVPNPVRSENTTVFRVSGLKSVLVDEMRVDIYDQNGRLVFTQEVAGQELVWHTVNDAGELLANGVYFYRVWVRINGVWYPTDFQKVAVVR